jgi:hypothetical protein
VTHHSFEKGLEKSFRKPKTDALEPSLEPTRPHKFAASRQKWECARFLSTWIADMPDSD